MKGESCGVGTAHHALVSVGSSGRQRWAVPTLQAGLPSSESIMTTQIQMLAQTSCPRQLSVVTKKPGQTGLTEKTRVTILFTRPPCANGIWLRPKAHRA